MALRRLFACSSERSSSGPVLREDVRQRTHRHCIKAAILAWASSTASLVPNRRIDGASSVSMCVKVLTPFARRFLVIRPATQQAPLWDRLCSPSPSEARSSYRQNPDVLRAVADSETRTRFTTAYV